MDAPNTRRYTRYHMHTPVFITVPGIVEGVVPGLVSKLSRAGMELYAGVKLEPGQLMEVEFRAGDKTIRIAGVVRSRSGFCFGLAFYGMRIEF
jgi:hypothetical protein